MPRLVHSADQARAVAVEERRTLTTYPFGDPNPIPKFGPLYPYFSFEGYSHQGAPREWRMVRMENPYIRVWIAPDIGGKVWGAIEKSTGQEFIYDNKVVKFRNIALRGPWTSGGIEFNFGIIGHTPSGATPVNWQLRQDPDGNAVCLIGAPDLASRTEWRVIIRLPADAAYFETECFWYNPTELPDSLYNWTTAAAEAAPDLNFYYPGYAYIGHDGKASPWPAGPGGRPLNEYARNDFEGSKSYHVLGSDEPFFGGYWKERHFGFGHWADYADKPGKKLWLWALSREGGIWHDLLTDPSGNPQYIEFQSGLFFNQALPESSRTPFKMGAFPTHAAFRWKEIWYPVKEIGGLSAVSEFAALHVTSGRDGLIVGLCPLKPLDERLEIRRRGAVIWKTQLKLAPMEIFHHTLPEGKDTDGLEIVLGDGKLRWSADPDATRLNRPLVTDPAFDWDSAPGCFTAGEELMKQRRYTEARERFQACLAKEPLHIGALARMAELFYRQGSYEEALAWAVKVLALDAYHDSGNYYYGLINARLGHLADARDGLAWASRSATYRVAALTERAALDLTADDYYPAMVHARQALEADPKAMKAHAILALALRLTGNPTEAKSERETILQLDPLNDFVRAENWLLQPSEATRREFQEGIRFEFPADVYLELATFYVDLGRTKEAFAVLDLCPNHPLRDYWRGWLQRQDKPAEAERFLKQAVQAPIDLLFPHHRELLPVLDWALTCQPHWKTRYYLALLEAQLGRTAEATQLLTDCGQEPESSTFYLARAALRNAGKAPDPATLADLRKAQALNPGQWRTWRELGLALERSGAVAEAAILTKKALVHFPDNYMLALDHARCLLHTGQPAPCLEILDRARVLPYEGAQEGRKLFQQAALLSAARQLREGRIAGARKLADKAREYPENLGVGKPYDTDERWPDLLAALAAEKAGDTAAARLYWENILAYTDRFPPASPAACLPTVQALQQLNRAGNISTLLAGFTAGTPAAKAVLEALPLLTKSQLNQAKTILQGLNNGAPDFPWNLETADPDLPLLILLFNELEPLPGQGGRS